MPKHTTPAAPNLRAEVDVFLRRELGGGPDAQTVIAEALPERCRSCKSLARCIIGKTLDEAQKVFEDAAKDCPVTHIYMGALVQSCVIEHREEQAQMDRDDRRRNSWYPG